MADGYLEIVPGTGPIETKEKFGDIQLHVEWAAPDPPVGEGQDRGNSGIFLMGQFEVQVLDSLQGRHLRRRPGRGDLRPVSAAVQRLPPARRVADLRHRLPPPAVRPAGKLLEPARVTVFHNGILVQNNEEPLGPTSWLEPTAVRSDRRPRPDRAPGPRPSRPVPQHLAPRAPRATRADGR